MKRSAFITALLGCIGIGKAQQWQECRSDVKRDANGKITSYIHQKAFPSGDGGYCSEGTEKQPALPNQCPVCGTMAAPQSPGFIFNIVDRCLDRDGKETACSKAPRVIRCNRCNAAFWQDAQ